MSKPLAIDLFCGLGGWSEGLLAEGFDVVGFDIERHRYPARSLPGAIGAQKSTGGSWFVPPAGRKCAVKNNPDGRSSDFRDAPLTGGWIEYPAQLVIQDVLTLHGSQFRDAALIVASPPCQAYSYRSMPWSRAKALPPPCNKLFEACFRIQREAIEAAGHHIPLVVENVRGAQRWVGRSRWAWGSFHLWGDVPALMPHTFKGFKSSGMNWSDQTKRGQDFTRIAGRQALEGTKNDGSGWRENGTLMSCNRMVPDGMKGIGGSWFGDTGPASVSSRSSSRKYASAMIAKIPEPLSRWIARTYRPDTIPDRNLFG